MFCEKCGNKLEPGDVFCPECGTRVSAPAAPTPQSMPSAAPGGYTPANNGGWQVPAKKKGIGGAVNLSGVSGKLSGGMSGGITNFIPSILGVLMLIWSFLPFIDINLGKIGELAGMFGGPDLSRLKFNLYQIRSTVANLIALDGDEEAKIISTILTVIVIFVVAVCIMAIVSGILNNKGLLLASGIMSAVCLILWIVYMIAVAHYKGMIMEEFSYEFGLDVGGMIPSIHGIGLYLMMITCAAHSFLAIRKATQM